MLKMNTMETSVSPTEILQRLGYPTPGSLPPGICEGPFEFKGVFDFDAATDTIVSDMLDYDNFDLEAFVPRLRNATKSRPEVFLAISGIEIVWIDQSTLDHADPEDVYRTWEGIYLEASAKGVATRTWTVRDGCHVAAQPAAMLNSAQATELRAYQYRTNGLQLFSEGTIVMPMHKLGSLCIKATGPASNSLLGANGDVRVRIHGVAWDADYDSWEADAKRCEAAVSQPQAIVQLDERAKAQAKMMARHTLNASRF